MFELNDILNKEQYRLKLNFFYFFGTKLNLIWLIFCYLFFDVFINFCIFYAVGALLLFRFLFSETKINGLFYKVFLFNLLHNLMLKIRYKSNNRYKDTQ